MSNIMVDLETMGTGSNAAIVAIGAVHFDSTQIKSEFYRAVDLESSVKCGMDMDPGTVQWWLKQSKEAQEALTKDGIILPKALDHFHDWAVGTDTAKKNIKLWGNGSDFDNVILINAYKACGMRAPWGFWNNRCYRTLKSLYPHVKMDRQGTHHNALDDARSQALHAIRILQSTRG